MTQAIHWRCFHCGDTFTKAQMKHARKHFGRDENEQPVCLIRSAGEDALLSALRNAQDELSRYRAEDTDLMRAMWALRSDHARRVRQAEEEGYAKGLRDAPATHDVAKELKWAAANGFTKPVKNQTILCSVANLEDVYRAVFGYVGDEPNVYADYDKAVETATKMRRAIDELAKQEKARG